MAGVDVGEEVPVQVSDLWHSRRARWLLPTCTVVAILASFAYTLAVPAQESPLDGTSVSGVFTDEFTGPAGSQPSLQRWQFQLGGGGWGNGELQTYTADPANVRLDGHGHLVITARRSGTRGNYTYTSARIASIQTVGPYLHAEARIKMAPGYGMWPTFWLMGGDPSGAGWPVTGEIDVAEMASRYPRNQIATAHGFKQPEVGVPPRFHWQSVTVLRTNKNLTKRFHTYSVDVGRDAIVWKFDGHRYKTLRRDDLAPGERWSFETPMHVILNVAVGGRFALDPKPSTRFPTSMVVDYVRVRSADYPPPVMPGR